MMAHESSIEGGCFCAANRYRIHGAPRFSLVCHCFSCRRASAAPCVAWLTFERSQVTFTAGPAQSYRSSAGVVRRFCAKCGSQLTYENSSSPDTIDITTLSLDDPNRFPPTAEVWVEHRLAWQPSNGALAQHPEDSSSASS
jgi:hypothetical protein